MQPVRSAVIRPLRSELAALLGWCLPGGLLAGVLVGGALLIHAPLPVGLPAAFTLLLLWGLLGLAGGLVTAGVRMLTT